MGSGKALGLARPVAALVACLVCPVLLLSQVPRVDALTAPAAPGSDPSGTAAAADDSCDLPRPDPLPTPGDPAARDFWQAFRLPLPPTPLWDPPGVKHVGLQAGHWLTEQVPPELGRLQQGSSGGGKQEWEVNLDLATRAAVMLTARGIDVDVLPATVPQNYHAHLFLAIHADGDSSGNLHGFKVARPAFSSVPDADDHLVDTLNRDYALATGLPRDDEHISRRMLYYYAFNSRRYCHAVAPGVPQAVIETGFLTSAIDRQLLIGDPDSAARGIASAVVDFLASEPS